MSTYLKHAIYCRLSGIQLAVLEYPATIGHPAYAKSWSESILVHPIFSLPVPKLLAFARGEFTRHGKQAAISDIEATQLQVAFLAILHSFGSIVQTTPAIPPLYIVQNNMQRLFELAYWQNALESKSFAFPQLRIAKRNANTDFLHIADYLDLCEEAKKTWADRLSDIEEEARAAAAERALKQLRNIWISPVTNKQLFDWIRANLPKQYEPDASGWLQTLFLGSEKVILSFEKADIQLMDDIIQTSCPVGTGFMKLCRARLDEILQIYTDNKEAFTVNFADYEIDGDLAIAEDGEPAAPLALLVPPNQKDFVSKVAFIQANAQYYLQCRAREQRLAQASPEAVLLASIKKLEQKTFPDAPF